MFTHVRKLVRAAAALLPLMALAAGCAQVTVLESQSRVGSYNVAVTLSPPMLNPPQYGNLNFEVTTASNDKPVKAFEPTSGALLHTVLISRDLQNFWHGYTQDVIDNRASVNLYFPQYSKYHSYTIFKPSGDSVQIITSTVTTGEREGEPSQLVEDDLLVKTMGWLTFELVKPSEVKAGAATQMVINVNELGNPVTALWPYLDAPGHVWIVDENGDNFAHLTASSEAHAYMLTPIPGQTATSTPLPNNPEPTVTRVVVPPAPTYAAGIANALATVNAMPPVELVPVQQTPQSFLQGAPEVLPGIGYGPNLAFTHTFPHAGMYKLWLDVEYRDQVVRVSYVVRVVE